MNFRVFPADDSFSEVFVLHVKLVWKKIWPVSITREILCNCCVLSIALVPRDSHIGLGLDCVYNFSHTFTQSKERCQNVLCTHIDNDQGGI